MDPTNQTPSTVPLVRSLPTDGPNYTETRSLDSVRDYNRGGSPPDDDAEVLRTFGRPLEFSGESGTRTETRPYPTVRDRGNLMNRLPSLHPLFFRLLDVFIPVSSKKLDFTEKVL